MTSKPTTLPGILRAALIQGAIAAGIIGVIGAVIGGIVAGPTGVWSALVGTVLAIVFLGITALSMLWAQRFTIEVFFAIVMGAWLLKFVLFFVVILLLKDQPWINPTIMFLSIIAGIIVTLVVDVLVITRSRMPTVSDITLPGE
jgi:hypothetical protein